MLLQSLHSIIEFAYYVSQSATSADATERLTRSLGCVHQVTRIKGTTRGMNATDARCSRIDSRVLPAWFYRSSKTVASLAIISLSDYFCVQHYRRELGGVMKITTGC